MDTFNWNPSVYEIAHKYKDKSLAELKSVLLEPVGKKMPEVHAGINLDDTQIKQIKLYLDDVEETGMANKKPSINKLLAFSAFFLLLVLAIVDLTFTRKIKFKPLHGLVIFLSAGGILYIIGIEAINLGRHQYYEPSQPIKFSHKVHAGINGTDCLYCHHTAEESKSASIPSTNVCMNCHTIVVEGTNSGKFEIAKIHKAMEIQKPVEWIKVHNLPDHVFFSHAQHVGAGKLDCAECHGRVEERDEIQQVKDLSMGWCLDCHRTRKVQFAENEYYKSFEELHAKLAEGAIDSVLVKDIGGEDCMKCHY